MRRLSLATSVFSVLLFAVSGPASPTAHAQDTLTVVVPRFATDLAPNLAEDLTVDLRDAVGRSTEYRLVDWQDLVDSVSGSGLDWAPPGRGGCIVGRQLAALRGIDLVVCGSIRTHRTERFKIDLVIIEMPEGTERWLPPVYARDREAARGQLVRRLEEWVRTG